MKNAVVTEAYVSGATKMEPANVEGAGERPMFLIFGRGPHFVFAVAAALFLALAHMAVGVLNVDGAPKNISAAQAQQRHGRDMCLSCSRRGA